MSKIHLTNLSALLEFCNRSPKQFEVATEKKPEEVEQEGIEALMAALSDVGIDPKKVSKEDNSYVLKQ